jgi:3-hydroxy-D-aspartate aldolase
MQRRCVTTPSLILEYETLDSNIGIMTAFAKTRGIGLRPHAKSHKSVEIARRLVSAGSLGACCATIDEAEALSAGGIGGLLVTSPLSAPHMQQRLAHLLLRGADLMVVADDAGSVRKLAAIATAQGCILPVIVELDVGLGRTGCADIDSAVEVAKSIAQQGSLKFSGVQAYWGNLQQIMPFEERRQKVEVQASKLRTLVAALSANGLPPAIVTGGGTGTHWLDASLGIFTELQAGSFLFMDSCYGPTQLDPGGNPFAPSLFVAASVVSANQPGRVTVNAGYKALATDSGKPVPMRGAPMGATYSFMGDEHGAVDFKAQPAPVLGDIIEFLTPHCDPTVNLYKCYKVANGDEIIDEWPISARGY